MRRHVYFYTYLDRDFDAVAEVLRSNPDAWLPPPTAPDRDGSGWVVDLRADGVLPAGLDALPACVVVEAGVGFDDRLLRAVRWRARAAEQLFPVLEADVDVLRLDASGCQLSLSGSHRPPLSVVGGLGDYLLGHRVAEACVRRFVLDVADRVATRTTRV